MQRSEVAAGYLAALGLVPDAPTPAFLGEIVQRHVARFPFTSVGPRLGDQLPLDLSELYQRIVVRRRGGYCFEQNALAFDVLEELGFRVRLYLARVIYDQDIHSGLTHRLTLVEIDGADHVVDVGFGHMGPARAVPMSGAEVRESARVFRVAQPRPGEFHMQCLKDDTFYSLYRFELARYGQADCELGHFYSHRHPKAVFVNHLVASRILSDEIRSLRDREYRVLASAGERVRPVTGATELHSILTSEFDLKVTKAECQRLFDSLP